MNDYHGDIEVPSAEPRVPNRKSKTHLLIYLRVLMYNMWGRFLKQKALFFTKFACKVLII